MRTRGGIAAALAGTLALGVGVAHASSLSVQTDSLHASTAQACTTAAITVTETPTGFWNALFGYTGVRFTLPAACDGVDVHVTVYSTSTGAVQAVAAAADVPAGMVNLTASATYGGLFNPAYGVALTLDGWSVPAAI